MDIQYEIAKYLANAGFGTLGTSIFAGQIPASTNGIWIERTGGVLNNYVPIEDTLLDIFVKSNSGSECITTLEQVKRYIHRMHTTQIDNSYIYTMLVVADVTAIQRDAEYDKIYKISVQIVHRDTTLIS